MCKTIRLDLRGMKREEKYGEVTRLFDDLLKGDILELVNDENNEHIHSWFLSRKAHQFQWMDERKIGHCWKAAITKFPEGAGLFAPPES